MPKPAQPERHDRRLRRRHADDVRHFAAASSIAVAVARLPAQIIARRLAIGREGGRLRDAEQDTGGEDEPSPSRMRPRRSNAHRTLQCGLQSSRQAGRRLMQPGSAESSRPEEGAEQQSRIARREAELLLQLRRKRRNVHRVEIIDEMPAPSRSPIPTPPPPDDWRLRHGSPPRCSVEQGRFLGPVRPSISGATQRSPGRLPGRVPALRPPRARSVEHSGPESPCGQIIRRIIDDDERDKTAHGHVAPGSGRRRRSRSRLAPKPKANATKIAEARQAGKTRSPARPSRSRSLPHRRRRNNSLCTSRLPSYQGAKRRSVECPGSNQTGTVQWSLRPVIDDETGADDQRRRWRKITPARPLASSGPGAQTPSGQTARPHRR